ncbi:MAG TPA: OmpA family protein [Bryobacteraceae bacterium]|nr:OmpA family protein [Bryobacteraceae bacterium]
MKVFLATASIVMGALLSAGCATHKYVKNATAPIQAKVDQVGDQTNKNSQEIQDTKKEVQQVDEKAQSGISAAQERASTADQHATTADQHANEAMSRANQVGDESRRGLDSLRQVVSNIDDYQLQTEATVPFKFNQWTLTPDMKRDLDKLAGEIKPDRRYFIAVEGFTDNVGDKQYNEALSRRRADSVVEYLVARHDIPIYRIHMIGLGDEKPVEPGNNRAARAKNRRVEVKVYSADQVTASLDQNQNSGGASRSPNQ